MQVSHNFSRAAMSCRRAESSARVRSLTEKPKGPVTVTEGRLLELWEETLGIDGLGVEDNYFALGGTSLETARLFAEIARHLASGFRSQPFLSPRQSESSRFILIMSRLSAASRLLS